MEKAIQEVLNLRAITNHDPSNGDIWRDFADGKMKMHDNGATTAFDSLGGSPAWTYEKVISGDVTLLDTNVFPSDFAINPIAYGAYEYEFRFLLDANASASEMSLRVDGFNTGEVLAEFDGQSNMFIIGVGDIGANSDYWPNGGTIFSNLALNVSQYNELWGYGKVYVHEFATYYGAHWRPYFDFGAGSGATLKAGSWWKLRRLYTESASL